MSNKQEPPHPPLHLAVLGLGLMGTPMARRLLQAGHRVVVWNRSQDKADALRADGAEVAKHPSAAVAGAQAVITMLTDGDAVADVLWHQGVATAMNPGAVCIDMSSIRPDQARAHAQQLKALGLGHLDAPVSGGTVGPNRAHWPSWWAAIRWCLTPCKRFGRHWAGPPMWDRMVRANWPNWPTK